MLTRTFGLLLALLSCATALSAQQTALATTQPPFTVVYWPGQQRLAERVLAAAVATDSLPGIPAAAWRSQEIQIVLAPNEALFQQSAGGRVPEWGAGVAVPDQGLIVLPAWSSFERGGPLQFGMVLRHELAHIAIHRLVAPARVPRWFDEGYSTWAAGELDWESGWQLRLAFATGQAPPLDSLELSWPRTTTSARLAYLLSASVIEYLVHESGTYGLQRLFERWRASGDFEQALIQTYGADIGQLESEWRRYVKRKYGWTAVVTQSALFGIIVGGIVIIFYLIRRRRDRDKLAALRASEAPEAPAYWTEGGIEIIAHRGYSARAPENTLAAMDLALRVGAGSLEFDVLVTADGVPVVIHDDTLDRTTNGRGRVADYTFEELRALDAGSWFNPAFAGEPIPALEEVLQAVQGRVNRLYIELKPHAFNTAQLDTVLELIERYDLGDRSVIMSFDWPYVEYIASRSVSITIAFLADDESVFLRALDRARADGRALVDCNYRILLANPGLAQRAQEYGVELAVYTVNDMSTAARLAGLGVRRITTNEVELLLSWARGRD